MDAEIVDKLTTNLVERATLVTVLFFFIFYFMKREERREKFISRVVRTNTRALRALAHAISKTEAGRHLPDTFVTDIDDPTDEENGTNGE